MAILPKPVIYFSSQVCMHGRSRAITDKLDRISLACVLFILIRYALSSHSCDFLRSHSRSYISIAVMIISNYGFFSTDFTLEKCQHYYLLAPIFKGLSSCYLPGLHWPCCSFTNYGFTGYPRRQVCSVNLLWATNCTNTSCRTFNIAKRGRRLGFFLLSLYIVSISVGSCTHTQYPHLLVLVRVVHQYL